MLKKELFVLLFIASCSVLFAQTPDAILGNWMSEKHDKIIRIYKANDLYYGKIIWLKDSEKGNGEKRLDIKNPNSTLKTRTILGIDFLIGFSYSSERKIWKEGRIYNFETGNTYTGKLHIINENELELTGFYGILWFLGRTQIWTRIKE